jgi:hypothetical protein
MVYRNDEITRIDQLTDEEQLAFGALMRLMVSIDGEISADERALLEDQAAELGEDAFWDMIDRAAEEASGPEQARSLAERVMRQPVRDLVFGLLYEASTAGTITDREMALLDELRTLWNVVDRPLDDD